MVHINSITYYEYITSIDQPNIETGAYRTATSSLDVVNAKHYVNMHCALCNVTRKHQFYAILKLLITICIPC